MGKYEEALELAKAGKPLDEVFPELKEREDEKIRKALLRYCDDWDKGQFGCMAKEDVPAIRAYLEKQKEPHFTKRNALFDECVANCDPAVMKYVSDEVDKMLQKEQKAFSSYDMAKCFIEGQDYVIRHPEKFGLQKPAEWSEEDEKMRDRILEILNKYGNIPVSGGKVQLRFNKEYMWLKHLYERFNPQPHWKPSEEQMEALRIAYEIGTANESWAMCVLKALYNDLKKL